MLIDLQLHSTYSDGYLSPTEVAKFIASKGVKVAALTDHNTVSGLDEFRHACQQLKIKPITGLELYIKFHARRFNILWYNFDDTSPELHNLLRASQVRRRRQVRLALNRLVKRGFKLEVDKILDKYNHYLPINHVVDEVIATRGNLKKIKRGLGIKHPREDDIIREYFRNKNIGVLHNSYIDIDWIIKLRKKIGGQLVLCHPAKNAAINLDLFQDLKNVGLDGIEKLSPHHSYGATIFIQYLAQELNLIETGSSDFHRLEGGNNPIQYSWQYYQVDSRLLRGVKKIIKI